MDKLIRVFIPLIIAFMFIGLMTWLAGASRQVFASESSNVKWLAGYRAANQPAASHSSLRVTTLDDELNTDGDCSLREAITAANENTTVDACPSGGAVITDTITFDVAGIITVTSQLTVMSGGPLVIDGGDVISTSGGGTTRVWWVDTGIDLTLQNLVIVDGYSDGGGGLYNHGGRIKY